MNHSRVLTNGSKNEFKKQRESERVYFTTWRKLRENAPFASLNYQR